MIRNLIFRTGFILALLTVCLVFPRLMCLSLIVALWLYQTRKV